MVVVKGSFRTWQRWPHFHAQGYRVSHQSLVRINKDFPFHLGLIDGWEGMEGPGPTQGRPVAMHCALASTDPVALDATAARLMGFQSEDIGYLVFGQEQGLGVWQSENITVHSNTQFEELVRSFTPHPTYDRQLRWKREGGRWESLLSHV